MALTTLFSSLLSLLLQDQTYSRRITHSRGSFHFAYRTRQSMAPLSQTEEEEERDAFNALKLMPRRPQVA